MIKAVEFEGQTHKIAEEQEEYMTLPARIGQLPYVEVTSCWELTEEDLERVKENGKIYITMYTFGNPLQPIRVESELTITQAEAEQIKTEGDA